MKKCIFLIFIIFLMVPSIVSAHTGLTSSTPSEGQMLKEDLQEITLNFNTDIEVLSTMMLLKEGMEIPIDDIKVEGQQMKGTLSRPLENGSYITKWKIVGTDGHMIEGEFPFTVQNAQLEGKLENPTLSEENQGGKTEEPHAEEPKNIGVNSPSKSLIITVLVASVTVLVLGMYILMRKKANH